MIVVVYRWLPWAVGGLALIELFILFKLAYMQGQLRALVAPIDKPRTPWRQRIMDTKVSALHVPKADYPAGEDAEE